MSSHIVCGIRVIFDNNAKIEWKREVLERIEKSPYPRGITNVCTHGMRTDMGNLYPCGANWFPFGLSGLGDDDGEEAE